jgi:hypothetical protein
MPITRRRLLTVAGCVLGGVGLFLAYLRMARAVTVNSDGASNALQAWDLFHGNPLLHGWTLSDVSFYPTELVQYALVQLVTGVTVDQIHVAAAMSWTLVVILAALLAGRRREPAPDGSSSVHGDGGREAGRRPIPRSPGFPRFATAVPAAIAVAILLVPTPGLGYQTLLSSPNHTGSAVPLLVAWLLVDRARDRAWMPFAVGAILALGALGDSLVTFVGAAPLVVVALVRAVRHRELRGVDARLVVAGLASVVASHAALWAIGRVGGFHAPRPPMHLSPISAWPDRAGAVWQMTGILFGTYRPGQQALWVEGALQAVHLPGLVLAIVALSLTAIRAARGRADRIDAVLVVAVVCDLGAEIVSTLPSDLLAAREIAPILPMSAVLVARVCGPWLSATEAGWRHRTTRPAARLGRWSGSPTGGRIGRGLLAVVLAGQLIALVGYAPPAAEPIEGQAAADWLRGHDLRYGLGSYWVSNNVTVGTSRQVTVVPVLSGGGKLLAMCWQTNTDMYTASTHDARFVLLEKERPYYGTPADVLGQFGPPARRQDIDQYTILIYDKNLLDGLGSVC